MSETSAGSGPTVFLLEDEAEAGGLLADFLSMNGYRVIFESRGVMGRERLLAHAREVALCILDVMVPEVDGFELADQIRRHPILQKVPIVFLTAKDRDSDEIEGLERGGDIYLRKPCSLQVILAHVRRLLDRYPHGGASKEMLEAGPISVDPEQRSARVEGKALSLTQSEYKILAALMRHPGRVYSRRELLELVAEDTEKEVFERTVDAHIKNLRLKLGDSADWIRTYRGLGYGLDADRLSS